MCWGNPLLRTIELWFTLFLKWICCFLDDKNLVWWRLQQWIHTRYILIFSEASEVLDFSLHKSFAPWKCKGRGCHLSACHILISISSNSFKDIELRFCTQTPHLNATKLSELIFEILFGGTELQGPWKNQ